MSGHFATLLRGTVQTLLRDHDVYVTDWHNVRDIPWQRAFDLDTFIGHIIDFVDRLGPHTHLVAVCQPTVPTLAAVAVMAEDRHPHQPRSMTLMAGPIDCRVNPTEVNRLATGKPIDWFAKNLIGGRAAALQGCDAPRSPGLPADLGLHGHEHRAPPRRVQEHVPALPRRGPRPRRRHQKLLCRIPGDDGPACRVLSADRAVGFQDYDLALGRLSYRGRAVRPEAIRRTALFTVEGERDDICSIGQTLAAHDLCSKLAPYRKQHHLQAAVGHYGVFNGKRWSGRSTRAFVTSSTPSTSSCRLPGHASRSRGWQAGDPPFP